MVAFTREQVWVYQRLIPDKLTQTNEKSVEKKKTTSKSMKNFAISSKKSWKNHMKFHHTHRKTWESRVPCHGFPQKKPGSNRPIPGAPPPSVLCGAPARWDPGGSRARRRAICPAAWRPGVELSVWCSGDLGRNLGDIYGKYVFFCFFNWILSGFFGDFKRYEWDLMGYNRISC